MIKAITRVILGLLLMIPAAATVAMAEESSPISIDMHYLVVSPAEDGSTNMMNMVNYTNTSSSEYKGDGTSSGVLKVTLPKGATGFNFLDNSIATTQTDFGFVTEEPIPANKTQVLPFSYRMPKGEKIELKFDYPVQLMQVLVPEGMGSVEINGVTSVNQGTFNFENQNYVGYSVEGIKANQTFSMVYNKDKQPEATSSTQSETKTDSTKAAAVTKSAPAFHNPGHIRIWEQSPLHRFNPHVFLIVISAIIIAGITYWIYFRRKARLEEEHYGADKEEKLFKLLMAKQKTIMDRIIELEDTHSNGGISEEDYQKKLLAYKEHLVQVKVSLQAFVE